MQLIQSRIVTDDVEGMASFYSALVGVQVPLNDYYVEVPSGSVSVGFSKCRYTEHVGLCPGAAILDFSVSDVDAEFLRVSALGVEWLQPPTTQVWGKRSMLFRDPEGHLVNVFSEVTR